MRHSVHCYHCLCGQFCFKSELRWYSYCCW